MEKINLPHEIRFHDGVNWKELSGQVMIYFILVYLLKSILLLHVTFV